MSYLAKQRAAKKLAEQEEEKKFMEILAEVADPNQPISKPLGFKKAYPKLFAVIRDAAYKYHEFKSGL